MWYLPTQSTAESFKVTYLYPPPPTTQIHSYVYLSQLNKWYHHVSSFLRSQRRTHLFSPSPFPLRYPSKYSIVHDSWRPSNLCSLIPLLPPEFKPSSSPDWTSASNSCLLSYPVLYPTSLQFRSHATSQRIIFPKRDCVTWLQTLPSVLELDPRLLTVAYRALPAETPPQLLFAHLPTKLHPISPYSVSCQVCPYHLLVSRVLAVFNIPELHSCSLST